MMKFVLKPPPSNRLDSVIYQYFCVMHKEDGRKTVILSLIPMQLLIEILTATGHSRSTTKMFHDDNVKLCLFVALKRAEMG